MSHELESRSYAYGLWGAATTVLDGYFICAERVRTNSCPVNNIKYCHMLNTQSLNKYVTSKSKYEFE